MSDDSKLLPGVIIDVDPVKPGAALARLRWEKTTQEERTAVAVELNARRWAGHVRKSPPRKRKGESHE